MTTNEHPIVENELIEIQHLEEGSQDTHNVLPKNKRVELYNGMGHVDLIDVMPRFVPEGRTADIAITRNARISTGKGDKSLQEDKKLLNYLYQHRHTSTFEAVSFKFRMEVPIFVERQIVRHRTACLSGESELWFDLFDKIEKGKSRIWKISIANFFDQWNNPQILEVKKQKPTFIEKIEMNHKYSPSELDNNRPRFKEFKKQSELKNMCLRMCNEQTGVIEYTNVKDIWQSGIKHIFEIELFDGYKIQTTKDHQFLTDKGWASLEAATGLHQNKNNNWAWNASASKFATNADQKLRRKFTDLKSIKYIGQKMTYDLEVAGPFHNFICNGFVTHNSINEKSSRYSKSENRFFYPSLRSQCKINKQSSIESEIDPEVQSLWDDCVKLNDTLYKNYEKLLESGIAREVARCILPVSQMTEIIWIMDLHNLFHFLKLRMAPDAQKEIRDVANAIFELIKPIVPMSCEAFEKFR